MRLVALILVSLFVGWGLLVPNPRAPVAMVALETPAAGLLNPLALEPHAPIHITDNAGFNTSNGVRSGSGTASDPYIISDWFFDASLYPTTNAMLWLENTDKYVTVRNCQVVRFDSIGEHYQAFYLGKYPGEITTPTLGPPMIDLTSNVSFLHNDIDSRYGYGIQIAEGSSNIVLRGNRVNIHPDNASGRDFLYGVNAARNTHSITIENNLVVAASPVYITIGIHMSDYYVSEERRASNLIARNNTVVDASGGIHVESSRFTLVRDNTIYQTVRNSLLFGWPRAITVRESALNASLIHNTIRNEVSGIVIGAATVRWDTYGPITGASNVTIQDNAISNVDSGISIGNVSHTRIVNTTFLGVGLQEFNLNGERGPPRDLTLTDPNMPVRIRAPAGTVPIHWSWTGLVPRAEYNLGFLNGTAQANVTFTTDCNGGGAADSLQPRTNLTAFTSYSLAGPDRLSGAECTIPAKGIDYHSLIGVSASVGIIAVAVAVHWAYSTRRKRRED